MKKDLPLAKIPKISTRNLSIAYADKGYRGDGEIPEMPAELWASASERYITIYELLTGETFEPGTYPVEARLVDNLKKTGVI